MFECFQIHHLQRQEIFCTICALFLKYRYAMKQWYQKTNSWYFLILETFLDIGIQNLFPFSRNDSLTLFFYRKKLVQFKELSCLQNCSFWWSDTKIKVVNLAKDYFSHFWQRFSSTDNAPTLFLNSSDIWYTFEMGISPSKSLVISLQTIIHTLDFNKWIEQIFDKMLSTVKHEVLVH